MDMYKKVLTFKKRKQSNNKYNIFIEGVEKNVDINC